MKVRTGAALAVVLVAAGAPVSGAAAKAKPVCQLVTDAAGDGTTYGVVPNRDAIDIRSADVASGPRNLVGVLRLASLADDPTLTSGVSYRLGWTIGGIGQEFALARFSDGSLDATFDPNTDTMASGDAVSAKVLVDPATSSITWTIDRKVNKLLAKKGARLAALLALADATAYLATPPPGNISVSGSVNGNGDSASSGKIYTDRAPSCVKGV